MEYVESTVRKIGISVINKIEEEKLDRYAISTTPNHMKMKAVVHLLKAK